MTRILTIDIETIPAPEPSGLAALSAKEQETFFKTALSGDFGRILCIGYSNEDDSGNFARGVLGWDEMREEFGGDEASILAEFWRVLRAFSPRRDVLVGHNIFDFDLKFIYKRSVILGVRPSVNLSFARYRNQPIFDTMHEWERWSYRGMVSLDKLAAVLGLASSKEGGVDGSLVYTLFRAGEHKTIRDYCLRDVELTRAIYRRMVFADHPSPSVETNKSMAALDSCAFS